MNELCFSDLWKLNFVLIFKNIDSLSLSLMTFSAYLKVQAEFPPLGGTLGISNGRVWLFWVPPGREKVKTVGGALGPPSCCALSGGPQRQGVGRLVWFWSSSLRRRLLLWSWALGRNVCSAGQALLRHGALLPSASASSVSSGDLLFCLVHLLSFQGLVWHFLGCLSGSCHWCPSLLHFRVRF